MEMGHNIGENIRIVRKENHLTQQELADKAGVNVQTIRSYESGKYKPKRGAILSIANALHVTPEYLQGFERRRVILPGRLTIVEIDDPELENTQMRIEATDEEAYNFGLQIFQNGGLSMVTDTAEGRIITALERLNEKGQAVAVERVEELTKIPDYQQTHDKPET